MRMSVHTFGAPVVCVALLLAGCGGAKRASPNGPDQPTKQTLSIANGSEITLACGDSIQLRASYGGNSQPTHVQWLVASGAGIVSLGGVYSAPLTLPTDRRITVT